MARGFYTEGINDVRNEYAFDKSKRNAARHKLMCKRFIRKNWFVHNVEFECQLYRGKSKFPRKKIMTCSEMGKENRSMVQAFIKAMDKNKDKPLWVWKIIDVEAFKQIKNKIVTGFEA